MKFEQTFRCYQQGIPIHPAHILVLIRGIAAQGIKDCNSTFFKKGDVIIQR